MRARTDRHNNPIAFTTAVAKLAGLVEGTDYTRGDWFAGMPGGAGFFTARVLGDPVKTCLRVIDAVGFYTKAGGQRWAYVGIPDFTWHGPGFDTDAQRVRLIGFMYQHEGGTEMRGLFPKV
jgi:hypothetical protein